MKYRLTYNERNLLSPKDQLKYDKAIDLCERENAGGPLGGWADGHDMLIELGWIYENIVDGHRTYRRLIKPKKYTEEQP